MARTKDFDENEVLSKAIQVFWCRGYNATSMQDLVDALGISRSSLYDTYKDKHTLFIQALERYQKEGNQQIQAIIDQNDSAKNTIINLLKLTISDSACVKEQKGCFMVNAEVEVAPHDAEVNKIVCSNDQYMEEVFYQVIKRGQDNGELKNKQDARALARFIFNAVKGMRVTAKSSPDRSIFDDIIKLTVSALN